MKRVLMPVKTGVKVLVNVTAFRVEALSSLSRISLGVQLYDVLSLSIDSVPCNFTSPTRQDPDCAPWKR